MSSEYTNMVMDPTEFALIIATGGTCRGIARDAVLLMEYRCR